VDVIKRIFAQPKLCLSKPPCRRHGSGPRDVAQARAVAAVATAHLRLKINDRAVSRLPEASITGAAEPTRAEQEPEGCSRRGSRRDTPANPLMLPVAERC